VVPVRSRNVRRLGWPRAHLCLVAAPAGAPGERRAANAVTTGLVHPAWRRRGIGERASDWAASEVGDGALRAETEALSEGAHALYLSKGLSQVFAEDVMQLAGRAHPPATHAPEGLILSQWDQADPARCYAVYQASFRDRPGFPGGRKNAGSSGSATTRTSAPEWTLLATIDGNDVGFIVGEATGWIVQMGVVPTARGKDIGARLIAEAVQRMRSAGETTITLNVNVDNPHATALYSRSASPVPVTAPVTRFKPDPHSPYALTHSGLIGV
jgi:mycothiol synthase